MTSIECPECGASNSDANRFCDSCGLALVKKEPREEGAVAPSKREQKNRLHQQRERQIVGRARTTLSGVQSLYGVLALLTVLMTLGAWTGYLGSEVRPLVMFVVVTLITAETCLNIAGFLFFRANPFVWTTVLACL